MRYLFVAVIFFCLALGFQPDHAFAQQRGAGIGIAPATIEEPAEPGEVLSKSITVSNLSSTDQTYYLFTRDIVGVESGGVPIFARPGQEITGYELSSWVTLNVSELTVPANDSASVDVVINVPETATPGSHFGGIFVSIEPPRMRSTGAAVAYEVANIVSIRVAGDAVEKALIRQFAAVDYIYGNSIVDFEAKIENSGTVLVRPIGPLEVQNMFGKRVAQLTFNEKRAGVFPGTTRDFVITWEDEGPGFGRYTAMLDLVYGSTGQQTTISSTATFWILPTNIIFPALGALAVLLLVTYISVKLYIRGKVNHSRSGARRIARSQPASGAPVLFILFIVMIVVTALFLAILLLLFS